MKAAIRQRAHELGFDDCGFTTVGALDGSLIFDASPQAGTDNFWRVRWAP